jgi:hypothetical protein
MNTPINLHWFIFQTNTRNGSTGDHKIPGLNNNVEGSTVSGLNEMIRRLNKKIANINDWAN